MLQKFTFPIFQALSESWAIVKEEVEHAGHHEQDLGRLGDGVRVRVRVRVRVWAKVRVSLRVRS